MIYKNTGVDYMRSNFNMSFDPVLKKEFAEVVSDYGLTVPQAFKLFANQVVKTQSIPLDFSWRANQDDQVNNTVLEILKQNMLEQTQGNSTKYAKNIICI